MAALLFSKVLAKPGCNAYSLRVMFEFTKADVSDALTLSQLWIKTFEDAYADVHSVENIRRYCDDNYTVEQARVALVDSTTECIIAKRNGEPAGLLVLKHHECPAGDLHGGASELKQIYVLSSQYGSGLGKALFDKSLKMIRSKNRKWVWLVVSDKNERARRFYEKHEFKPVGEGPALTVGTDKLPSTIMAALV